MPLLVLVGTLGLAGCSSKPKSGSAGAPNPKAPLGQPRLDLTGPDRTQFAGYYQVDGKTNVLAGYVPTHIIFKVRQVLSFEVRKVPDENVRNDRSELKASLSDPEHPTASSVGVTNGGIRGYWQCTNRPAGGALTSF